MAIKQTIWEKDTGKPLEIFATDARELLRQKNSIYTAIRPKSGRGDKQKDEEEQVDLPVVPSLVDQVMTMNTKQLYGYVSQNDVNIDLDDYSKLGEKRAALIEFLLNEDDDEEDEEE